MRRILSPGGLYKSMCRVYRWPKPNKANAVYHSISPPSEFPIFGQDISAKARAYCDNEILVTFRKVYFFIVRNCLDYFCICSFVILPHFVRPLSSMYFSKSAVSQYAKQMVSSRRVSRNRRIIGFKRSFSCSVMSLPPYNLCKWSYTGDQINHGQSFLKYRNRTTL